MPPWGQETGPGFSYQLIILFSGDPPRGGKQPGSYPKPPTQSALALGNSPQPGGCSLPTGLPGALLPTHRPLLRETDWKGAGWALPTVETSSPTPASLLLRGPHGPNHGLSGLAPLALLLPPALPAHVLPQGAPAQVPRLEYWLALAWLLL